MRRTSALLASIAESATLAVDAKAKALKAQGENVIGFGAGEPDFPTPANIVEAAVRACRDPKNHRYTPAAGQPELREAIATKTKRDSGFDDVRGGREVRFARPEPDDVLALGLQRLGLGVDGQRRRLRDRCEQG